MLLDEEPEVVVADVDAAMMELVILVPLENALRFAPTDTDVVSSRTRVAQLRKKLADDAAGPRLIVTHIRLGYRWIGEDDA